MTSLWDRLTAFLISPQVIVTLVWTGMFALTVALIVLMRTRWGHQKPLRKCAILSLFAHVLLVAYATTVHFVRAHPGRGHGTALRVTMIDGHDAVDEKGTANGVDGGRMTGPWEAGATAVEVDPEDLDLPPAETPQLADGALDPDAPPTEIAASEAPVSATEQQQPDNNLPVEAPQPPVETAANDNHAPENLPQAPTETNSEAPAAEQDLPPLVAIRPRNSTANSPVAQPTSATPSARSTSNRPTGSHTVPEMYRERLAPNRLQIAEGYGGSAQTEAAVEAALEWLARHQAADGRWDASDHGAGVETRALGRDRQGAGAQADTGLTGLALLAFLGAGHTHRSDKYGKTVGRGLDYLLASQATDGNLAGRAEIYAYMYCHGMATLALSEDYAMTGDPQLTLPVHRAIAYTITAQNLSSGGWRYKPPYPTDRGDTSQLGWQLMSLKSAELSGIGIPERTRQGIIRYLNSVSSGRRAGLAAYRPDERATHSMTAEALVCREFLGRALADSSDEAAEYLLSALPGQGQANFYYWYYGTLAMFQLQGDRWTKWNDALANVLTHTQRGDGDAAGSWEPDALWGGYGGRVFSTSLGALCLEVYYRYLPVYTLTAGREKSAK